MGPRTPSKRPVFRALFGHPSEERTPTAKRRTVSACEATAFELGSHRFRDGQVTSEDDGTYVITLPVGSHSVDTGGGKMVLLGGTFSGIVQGPRKVTVRPSQTTVAVLKVVSGSDHCT